jgi:hypothetical protein
MTAAEVTAAAESDKMTAAEMTAAAEPAKMTAAEMTASAEPTVPGKGFAHHPWRERALETEPERDRRCENFCHSTRHRAPFPLHLRKL